MVQVSSQLSMPLEVVRPAKGNSRTVRLFLARGRLRLTVKGGTKALITAVDEGTDAKG